LALAAEHLSKSTQPLVPERVFVSGGSAGENGGHGNGVQGMLGTLISMLVAEKSGFATNNATEIKEVRELVDRITRQAVNSIEQGSTEAPAVAAAPPKEVAKAS
jgi:hypothetical protein